MELWVVVKAILALVFVLGLLFLLLWLMKYFQTRLPKKIGLGSKIRIMERKKVDARNTLVLVETDAGEHLILVGQGQSLLIETKEKDRCEK